MTLDLSLDVPSDPPPALPSAPRLGGALRAAGSDLFFHSIRVVPLNVVWGAIFLLGLWSWAALGSIPAALVASLLGIPTAGLARLGALATRARDVNLTDGLQPLRRRPAAVLGGGLAFTGSALVLVTNVLGGLFAGGPVGWALATLAGWGLVALAAFGATWWPLLADPLRDERPARELTRLAALLLLAHPLRFGALTVTLGIVLALSTVVFAALLTISVGFAVLAACRFVLPAADRLEARLGGVAPTG